ncbi:MAG: tetratricopeptide repeat protein [Bacteroidetes bacterium]|jgi:tetratricopeptide (TPR) repeat protein|nr:MAG: tetratricopeptide repeat protein [Bacteroidota bacterium]
MNRISLILLTCFSINIIRAQSDTVKIAAELTPEQKAQNDYNTGLNYLNNNQPQSAIQYFTQALQNLPNFEKAYYNRALAHIQLKNYTEALKDIDQAINLKPIDEYYFTKSLIYFYQNKKDEQEQTLLKTLEINPNHAEANYYLGMLYFNYQDYDKALNYYQKAVQAKSDYAYAYNDLASTYLMKNDLDNAIKNYELAAKYAQNAAFIYNNLGSAYRQKKDYSKAISAYNKAIQTDENYFLAYINNGATKLEKGDIAGAKADFEKLIQKDPKNSAAYNGLAGVYIKEKDYKKAKEMATKAIELDNNNGQAYYNRGIARQMLREEDDACNDWKKALELGITPAKSFISTDCSE